MAKGLPKNLSVQSYSDEYKWKVRQQWYQEGRPTPGKLLSNLVTDEYGRKPNPIVISMWRKNELWDIWADELDSRVMQVAEDSLIVQKAEMLKRHAQVGWLMIDKGMEFLASGTFDSSSSAVAAIKAGVEIERTSRGIGDMLVRMSQMGDDALKQEIMKYINRASENNQIVDAEEIPDKEESTDK